MKDHDARKQSQRMRTKRLSDLIMQEMRYGFSKSAPRTKCQSDIFQRTERKVLVGIGVDNRKVDHAAGPYGQFKPCNTPYRLKNLAHKASRCALRESGNWYVVTSRQVSNVVPSGKQPDSRSNYCVTILLTRSSRSTIESSPNQMVHSVWAKTGLVMAGFCSPCTMAVIVPPGSQRITN